LGNINKTNKYGITYSLTEMDGVFCHTFDFNDTALKILPENFQAWIDSKSGKSFSWDEVCKEFFDLKE